MNNVVDDLAEKLYEECQTVKPRWSQIGEVCRSVWCERAVRVLAGISPMWVPIEPVQAA